MKKGLVLVFDPHNLFQFIWYYKAYGCDFEWTALCMPNGLKKEYMSGYCIKSEIFKNVVSSDDVSFEARPVKEKIFLFIKMFFCFLLGKRKSFCRKIINRYIDFDVFERIVIICESGIVTGAITAFADEKDIVVLDDGGREYQGKRSYLRLLHKQSRSFVAAVLSFMKYASPCGWYPFKPLKKCTKFLCFPDSDLVDQSIYGKVVKAYDESVLSLDSCKPVYEKVYGRIDVERINKCEAVLLLGDYYPWTNNSDCYVTKIVEYVNRNFSKIVVKTHPRDKTEYKFDSGIDVYEIDRTLPGELIVPYIKDKLVIVLYSTTMLMFMLKNRIRVLLFNSLVEEKDCSINPFNYPEQKKFLDSFVGNYEEIYLDL